ncbi:MAG: iron complex transport system ATP-binding protein [Puniceicoccaceae bacterium 5H]|nr:MAG: iron complex transport system ATP-binding protein [Puniceicoccaceae bacterium 5H]
MLRVTDTSVTRNGRRILGPVSCELQPARMTAIIGPNGAGKSTLLRVMSGALPPDEGTVELHGCRLEKWAQHALARCRAVLAQSSQLQFSFSVREVVMLGRTPHMRGFARREDHQSVWGALDRVGMQDFADRDFTTLSGGEKQRVQLARALVQIQENADDRARFLLLDEPVSALDLKYQHEVLQLARSLANEGLGVCVILHDLNQALDYADYVLALHHGQIEAEGHPAEVLTPDLVRHLYEVEARYTERGAHPHLRVSPPAAHSLSSLT